MSRSFLKTVCCVLAIAMMLTIGVSGFTSAGPDDQEGYDIENAEAALSEGCADDAAIFEEAGAGTEDEGAGDEEGTDSDGSADAVEPDDGDGLSLMAVQTGAPAARGPALPAITITALTIAGGHITQFKYSGFTLAMVPSLQTVTAGEFTIHGAANLVTSVAVDGSDLVLNIAPPLSQSSGYSVEYTGPFPIWLDFDNGDVDNFVVKDALPFTLRNECYPYIERTVAAVIDAGEDVVGSALDASKFSVFVEYLYRATMQPEAVADNELGEPPYRTITDIYVSKVDNYGTPASDGVGRYIVLKFKDWEQLSECPPGTPASNVRNPDWGSTENKDSGRSLYPVYTITYNGAIVYNSGDTASGIDFMQTDVINPILDKFQYGKLGNFQYRYYINEEANKPLPLVVFFHGMGKGYDNEAQIRASNGATIWLNAQNKANYPCHVLAPANGSPMTWNNAAIDNTALVVQKMIDDGLVDKSRVYITGLSMGGGAVWMFLQRHAAMVAAAAPMAGASGITSVANANLVSEIPIWAFVTKNDPLCWNAVMNNHNNYGRYLKNYKLTTFEENKVMAYPHNGFVFDPHCAWIPAYTEYVDPDNGRLIEWMFAQKNQIREFTLRNENQAFTERTVATVIDLGEEMGFTSGSLRAADFSVLVEYLNKSTMQPEAVTDNELGEAPYRTITDVYVSKTNNYGTRANDNRGRYIVLKYKDWGLESEYPLVDPSIIRNPDWGSTENKDNGRTLYPVYTITYSGSIWALQAKYKQTAVISPVIDKFQYGQEGPMPYRYFISETGSGPLPLVIYFHGGGKGNDNETQIRFSNGATVWANPANQASNPCHVLAPANANGRMENVVAIVERWVAEGKVDPARIYATGFSMGGMATWELLNNYPDLLAAAAPMCGGSPANVSAAQAVGDVPIWAFVTKGDFTYAGVVGAANTYGQYLKNFKLSILEDNHMMSTSPVQRFTFAPHAVWIPVYNEYIEPAGRGTLYNWMFAQKKEGGLTYFDVLNISFVNRERTAAIAIDLRSDVATSSLSISDFEVTYRHLNMNNNNVPNMTNNRPAQGTSIITKVYANSAPEMTANPPASGQYVIIELRYWPGENDAYGTTATDSAAFRLRYTVTQKAAITTAGGGTIAVGDLNMRQRHIKNPIIDKYAYGTKGTTRYRLFTPDGALNANGTAAKKMPLIVFLHGGGQGTENETHLKFQNNTIFSWPENQAKYPSYVLSPAGTWSVANRQDVKAMIDQMVNAGKVDPNRIYVTGYSMGGGGTWNILQDYPDLFACAAPICAASGLTSAANAQKFADFPIWCFVTTGDPLCWSTVMSNHNNYSRYLNDYKLTIFPDNYLAEIDFALPAHAAWMPAYCGAYQELYPDDRKDMKLFDWMFKQTKAENRVSITAAPDTVISGSNLDPIPFKMSVIKLRKANVISGTLIVTDSRFDVSVTSAYPGATALYNAANGNFTLFKVGGFTDTQKADLLIIELTPKSGSVFNNGDTLTTILDSIEFRYSITDTNTGITPSQIEKGTAATNIWKNSGVIGDISGDGVVGSLDLSLALLKYGKMSTDADWYSSGAYIADIDGNGIIDMADIMAIAYMSIQ